MIRLDYQRTPDSRPPADDRSSMSVATEYIGRAAVYFRALQDRICAGLEEADGPGRFREDLWERSGGGGGRTRVLVDGGAFEKAGVNFSEVHGELSPEFASQIPGEGRNFAATGISLVLPPR